jgi:hypothetical protein
MALELGDRSIHGECASAFGKRSDDRWVGLFPRYPEIWFEAVEDRGRVNDACGVEDCLRSRVELGCKFEVAERSMRGCQYENHLSAGAAITTRTAELEPFVEQHERLVVAALEDGDETEVAEREGDS